MIAEMIDTDQALNDRTYADALHLANDDVGEVVACFGRYRSKTFNWIIQNDPGYVKYLWRDHRQTDEASLEGKKEVSVFTWHLAHYAHSFPVLAKTIDDVLHQGEKDVIADRTGDDSIRCVKFGILPNITYQESYDSKDPRHTKWLQEIRKKQDVRYGTSMYKFRNWVLSQDNKERSGTVAAPDAILSSLPASFLACPETLPSPSLPSLAESRSSSSTYSHWTCSSYQAEFVVQQMSILGIMPTLKSYGDSNRWKGQSLWRLPPPPELQYVKDGELPDPSPFYLKPVFLWAPEKILAHLLPQSQLPCIKALDEAVKCSGHGKFKNVGNLRIVFAPGGGSSSCPNPGQYYIYSSRLQCSTCSTVWQASDRTYLPLLPSIVQSMFPAYMAYNKALCKTAVDEMMTGSRSPSALANDFNALAHNRYELAHKQYLQLTQMVRKRYADRTRIEAHFGKDLPKENTPFGSFDDASKYCGKSVSYNFITTILKELYEDQKPYLDALQKGVFGNTPGQLPKRPKI